MYYSDLEQVNQKKAELLEVQAGLATLQNANVTIKVSSGNNYTGDLSGLHLVNGGVGLKGPIIDQYEAAEAAIIAELEALGVVFP